MENRENALNSEELKQVSGGKGFYPSEISLFECLECGEVFECAAGDDPVCPKCKSENCNPVTEPA